jgi:hypothetical protein
MQIKILILIVSLHVLFLIKGQGPYCTNQTETYVSIFDANTSGEDFADVERVTYTFTTNNGTVLDGIVPNIGGNINFNDIYTDNVKDSQGRVFTKLKFSYVNIWGTRKYSLIKDIIVQGDNHLSINLPNNVCQGSGFDIRDYTSQNYGTFTTSNNSYLTGQDNDEIKVSENAQASTYTINWESVTNGCVFTKTDNIEIRSNPILTFPNVQSGQILDTDNTLYPLNANTNVGTISYQGVGITNSNFKATLSGQGVHIISAIATNQYNCKTELSQTIEVTHDPGNPDIPIGYDLNVTDGYRQVKYIANTNQFFGEFDLCDAQSFNFRIVSNNTQGIDSANYYYVHNGIEDTIGRYHVNQLVNYTIPQTNLNREDYIYTSLHSNLGIEGGRFGSIVNVNASNQQQNELICIDNQNEVLNVNYNSFGINLNYITKHSDLGFIQVFDSDTLINSINELDTIKFRKTRNYVWRDINNNILDTTYNYNHTSPNKYTKYIREEYTILPFKVKDSYSNGSGQPLNFQTCRKYDTIEVVLKPNPNYNYSGDTLILGGTTVQIENTSTLADYVSFDFFNGKGEQIGDTIVDTLFINNGIIKITAYDNYGCSNDSTNFSFVRVTNDPKIGLIDSISSGSIYPVRNGEFTFSGETDSSAMEMHICDGASIDLSIDSSMLAFPNGIDSVYYFYYANGIVDTIGKYGIYENVSYVIPKTTLKRVDSITSQLTTVIGEKGDYFTSPVFVSTPLQREPTTQILNCNESFTVNTNEFIGQNNNDYIGLNQFVLNSIPADPSTFTTQFRDINDNLITFGSSFSHTLLAGNKIDTLFRKEITNLPFKGSGFNYFSKIGNPQTCELNDTILVVRPPVASFIYQGNSQVVAGTSVRHISTSQYTDWVEWDFKDGSEIYYGDTMWHAVYDIGDNDINVMAYDIYGCADTLIDQAYIEVIDWTDIKDDFNTISEIKSYPNPMKDNLYLEIISNENLEVTLTILDMQGKTIINNNINLVNSLNTINLDVSELSRGIYTCKIIGINVNVSQKLIKQ